MPVEPVGMPGYIAAFGAAADAANFMVERGETSWEFKLISRSTLASLLSELRLLGKKGFCIDPKEEGGKSVDFDSLEGFAT